MAEQPENKDWLDKLGEFFSKIFINPNKDIAYSIRKRGNDEIEIRDSIFDGYARGFIRFILFAGFLIVGFGGGNSLNKPFASQIESIKLVNRTEITTDECAALLILGPEKDYTEDEAKIVINYLNNGGKAIIGLENLTSQGVDKPNFNSILKEFGINVQSGVVAENNTSYYSTQYGPWFAFADGITGYASGLSSYVFAPYASGLKQVKDSDDSITYTALASTSSDSVLKTNASKATTYKKESGDVDGPFDIVVSVEKTVTTTKSNDDSNKSSDTSNSSEENSDSTDETTTNTASLLVFGSVYSLSDTMDNSVSQSNTQIVNNALKDYIDTEVETVSVPAKSLSSEQLTVTESGSRLFGILISVVVPVIILLAGIVVWVRRRKR